MAIIIKRQNRPVNNLSHLKNTYIPHNTILNKNKIKSIKKADVNYNFFRHQIRSSIEQFLHARISQKEQALSRGFRQDKTDFVVALLLSFKHWHTSVNQEALAMVNLAEKISETILTTTPDSAFKEHYLSLIQKKLHHYFQIELLLPNAEFNEYHPLWARYCQISPCLSLLTLTKHDKEAMLRIKLIQENFIISLLDVTTRSLWIKIVKIFLREGSASSINCVITTDSQQGMFFKEERENP